MPIHDIGKIRRRGTDIDHQSALPHQRRINAQSTRMARIEEGRARLRHHADIWKARRFKQRGILLPTALSPARRAAHYRAGNLRHQRRLCAHELGHHALRKRAHIARGSRICQISGFKAHLHILRPGKHTRLFPHHDAPIADAHRGEHACTAKQGHHAWFHRGIPVKERHRALPVAQVKSQDLHALTPFCRAETAATPRRSTVPS